jgi:class 3 adenylate cyclase
VRLFLPSAGEVVNVAACLQQEAKDDNILLNHSIFSCIQQHIQVTKLPPLTMKNKAEPLHVLWLIGID